MLGSSVSINMIGVAELSASWAATSSYNKSSSYSISSSYSDTASWSINSQTSSFITGSKVFGTVLSSSYSLTASYVLNGGQGGSSISSSWASSSLTASYVDYNNVVNKPTLISSSLQFTASSNATFGNITASIISASIYIGNLTGTSSYSSISLNSIASQTSSFVTGSNVVGVVSTSSYSISSSTSNTSSYVLTSQTASYYNTSSLINIIQTSSMSVLSSSFASTSSYFDTSSLINKIQTSSMSVLSSSFSLTASFVTGSNVNGTVTSSSYSISSLLSQTASYYNTSSLINVIQTASMSVLSSSFSLTSSFITGSNVNGRVNSSSYSVFSISSSYTSYVPESSSLWTSSFHFTTTSPSSSTEALNTLSKFWYKTDHELHRLESTQLDKGGILSINNSGSINISSGSGHIIDQNPNYYDFQGESPRPIVYDVVWGNFSNVIIPNTGSKESTYIAIDYSGSIIQQNSLFSDIQRRDYIYLGKVIHRTGQITSTVNEGSIGSEPVSHFRDLAYTLGPINIFGNVYYPSGSSLQINKSSGETYRLMSNYNNNYKSPSRLTNPQQYQCNLYYAQRNSANDGIIIYSPSSSINPNQYDNGGGILTTVTGTGGGNNRWTIQRIYYFPFSNTTYVFYGQAEYATLSDAKTGLATETFSFISPDFNEASMFRGWLLIRKNETNLSSVDTVFLSAGKFGNIGSSPSIGGTITNFSDNTFSIYNSTDSTKTLVFNLNQIPTGAKLSLTASNAVDGTSITFPSVDGKLLLETGSLFGTSSWANTASYVNFNNIAGTPTLVSSSAQVNTYTTPITASIISSSLIIGTTLQGNGFNVLGVNYNSLINTPSQLAFNIPTASLTDLIYYNNSFANSDGVFGGSAVNPGFKLVSIVASSSAATTINIGTSPLDNNIVNSEVINTSMDEVPLGKQFFSPTNQTPLYISSPSWAGNSVNVICKFEKIVGTISSSAALSINVNAYKSSTNSTASNNDIILSQTTSGTRRYQLPLSFSNSTITIKKITSDSNYVYVYPSGSQMIDGSTSPLVIQYYNSSVTLVGDGLDWYII